MNTGYIITEKAILSSDDSKIFHTFDEMKIEVPLPFKDYDILIERYVYCAVPFEYKMNEFQFSDTGLGLSSWVDPFEEEIYVSNYLNLEYASKIIFRNMIQMMRMYHSEYTYTDTAFFFTMY